MPEGGVERVVTELPKATAERLQQGLRESSRVLLCGAPATDRIAACRLTARTLATQGTEVLCLAADTALPAFGAPGAVALARWEREAWTLLAMRPLCSLDPVRFRLPLIEAVSQLLAREWGGTLLVQAPGIGGGVAGEELLGALASVAGIDALLYVSAGSVPAEPPIALQTRGIPLVAQIAVAGHDRAERRAIRDRLWHEYLGETVTARLRLGELQLLGAPPPLDEAGAWRGRQVAALWDGQLRSMGEIIALEGGELQLRTAEAVAGANQLLLRDAIAVAGSLQTVRKPRRRPEESAPASGTGFLDEVVPMARGQSCGPVPVARIGQASACLVNGVFGDPLLKLQLLHQRRNLLFDLGDPGRMSARVAHQVSDLFLSHTHADHIGGFLWFLRSRIGELPACRVFGPPGVAGQIAGLVDGILWDRVAERAPRFEIREWHDDHLRCYRVVAGEGGAGRLQDLPLADGVVWQEAGFRVRAARLDHRTPVLAYAWEPALRVRVRRERLVELGLRPGRWLQQLKQAVLAGRRDESIATPDGATHRVGELQDRLLLVQPGQKLVYATDFADTPDNRRRLVALAAGAHSLFCEASFMLEDAVQAHRTQHLTTRACAEIANEAEVGHLLPFHFSQRYIQRAPDVYREIRRFSPRTVLPGFLAAGIE